MDSDNYEARLTGDDLIKKKNTKLRKFLLIGIGFIIVLIILIILLVSLLGVASEEKKEEPDIPYSPLFPMKQWGKNEDDKVYYYVGLRYVENANEKYQKFAIYVPSEYLKCEKNLKRYKCQINKSLMSLRGEYNALNAPIVFPIDTPGYLPVDGPREYDNSHFKKYTDQGFIYIQPGCRGSTHGAPLGIVDLKIFISYIKQQKETIPGNVERIFSMGMSEGGAQSSLMGVSGNAKIFDDYFNKLNITHKDNSIYGTMCWSPITNLDVGNRAYEWNIGMTREIITEEEMMISRGLAKEYANYINNEAKLKDEEGHELNLSESSEIEDFYYQSGTYYEYIKKEVEESFSNWVQDTKFPYVKNMTHLIPKEIKSSKEIEDIIDASRTFNTLEEYLNYLNEGKEWIKYDKEKNKTEITDLSSFAKKCKKASKEIGAYDNLKNKNTPENLLFGVPSDEKTKNLHFDEFLGKIAKKEEEFKEDLKTKDFVGKTVTERLEMYSPLNYIKASNESGFNSSIAKHWRIRSGIFQGDAPLCTEINLKLALINKGVEDVDFQTVWEASNEKAERGKKDSDEEFIAWVNNIMKKEIKSKK